MGRRTDKAGSVVSPSCSLLAISPSRARRQRTTLRRAAVGRVRKRGAASAPVRQGPLPCSVRAGSLLCALGMRTFFTRRHRLVIRDLDVDVSPCRTRRRLLLEQRGRPLGAVLQTLRGRVGLVLDAQAVGEGDGLLHARAVVIDKSTAAMTSAAVDLAPEWNVETR